MVVTSPAGECRILSKFSGNMNLWPLGSGESAEHEQDFVGFVRNQLDSHITGESQNVIVCSHLNLVELKQA